MKPDLSIVVASFNAQHTVSACLQSLRQQKTEKLFEIILVDSSTDVTGEVVEKAFPEVRLYRFDRRHFCGDARNLGISVAKAQIIAFIDADCTADRTWVEEVLKAHEQPSPAVGGAIANGTDSWVGWAMYFCEFSKWMPNTADAWMTDVAGANMSYKRKIFEEIGPFIEGTYCSDTEFHWRLARHGHRLRFEPAISISHHYTGNFLDFVRHECLHGRSFARVRVQAERFFFFRRAAHGLLFFLLPFKFLGEILLRNLRYKRYFFHFARSLPLVIAGLVAWSFGECLGYIEGANR